MTDYIVVPADHSGMELDEFLCLAYPELTKGFVRRQVRSGRVLVDGESARPTQRLREEQVLVVDLDELAEDLPTAPVAPDVELRILHEDEDTMVVDKPPGLAVEPERWHRGRGTLSGALLALARERSGAEAEALSFRPRIAHRIDKETSGCVVVAKSLDAERALRAAFERGEVGKVYLALVEGEVPLRDGETETIDLPVGSDERRSGRMRVDERGGKPSRTRISVEERFRGFTLVRAEPLTGRTHQIRVHLAAKGFPLAVDRVYGRHDAFLLSRVKSGYRPKPGRPERPLLDRLSLHALAVDVPRPGAPGERLRVESPLPPDLERVLKQLAKVRPWRARGVRGGSTRRRPR